MSAGHHDRVEPTPFEVARPDPAPAGSRSGISIWILPALAVLAVVAGLVIFWLPGAVTVPPSDMQPGSASGGATAEPATGPPAPAAAPSETAPWSEAQQAKLRKQAQDVLEKLLDIQFNLEERGVRQWAPERYAAAKSTAATADERYRDRDFVAAEEGYHKALEQFTELADSVPAQMERLLDEARAAVESGDRAGAETALEVASLIDPDAAAIAALRQRAEAVPQMQHLLEQSAELEASGELAAAEARLSQATQLDPEHQGAATELRRVAAALRERRFNDAMSSGYAALEDDHFDSAREAFRRAATLRPDAEETANALVEVAAAETAASLADLRRRGRQFEDRERWQAAVEAYEAALAIDDTLLFAREGLERTRPRAELDEQLQEVIEQPERLADIAVARDTAQLLEQARAVSPNGPVLREQIARVAELLRKANTPVAVTLRSDGETRVTVYKVAQLGRFEEQQLQLRPGNYTAVGTRVGYRDVRREFTVSHDTAPEAVTVICTEPV